MQPRDIFDGILLVALGLVLFFERQAGSLSLDPLRSGLEVLLALDVVVYLVVAGAIGVVFVGYIAVYLPYKQSENASRR